MALYRSWLGETGDGFCRCGAPATTEVQVGWHNADHPGEQPGGQYDEICDQCLAEDMPGGGPAEAEWLWPLMQTEMHNLHGVGETEHDVYHMPGPPSWDAITDVPCPVRGCDQTVLWYEAGYVSGYRVCMRPTGTPNKFDMSSIRHRFLGDPARAVLILDE